MCLDCFNAHQLLSATFLKDTKLLQFKTLKKKITKQCHSDSGFVHESSTRQKSHDVFALSVKFAFAGFA